MRTAEQVRERDKKMTYEEAKAFLADCNQYKGEISLEPLKKMLAILGNPQDQLKFVHVAEPMEKDPRWHMFPQF